jgi:hypothetical protein
MARFQRHTVPWCSRSSSSRGTPSPPRASSGSWSPQIGSSGSWWRTLSSNRPRALERSQSVPNATRETSRSRPGVSRSSAACSNRAMRVSSHSTRPRNSGELPAAASTGAVASWAALKLRT